MGEGRTRRHDQDHLHARRPRGRGGRRRDHLAGRPARTARRSRICAGIPHPAIAPTATAAPAWSRSRASACWPPPASARPRAGMKVKTASERAKKSREMVFELLARRPAARARTSHDPKSKFWNWIDAMGVQPTSALRPRRAARRRQHPHRDLRQSRRLHQLRPVRARLPRGADERRDRHGLSRRRLQGRVRLRQGHGRLDLRRLRRVRAGVPDRRADGRQPARPQRPASASRSRTSRSTRCAPIAASAARPRCTSRTTRSSTSTAATAPPTTTGCASRAASASTTSTTPTA